MIVSVVVITYNSSKTVISTLESILNQTYGSQNIELIISDDASTDDTVKVIQDWLSLYKNSFYKVLLNTNSINLGVSGNINTGWKIASSQWIKSIAGDDLLDEKCIELNVNYVKENLDCKILFSKIKSFGQANIITPTLQDLKFFTKNSKQQYNWLSFSSFNIAPSSFINTNLLKEVNYADEKYRMIEDLPLWLKITKAGYKLHFLNVITVYYRVDESVSFSNQKFINKDFTRDLAQVHNDHRQGFLKNPFIEWLIMERLIQYKLMLLISNVTNNNKGIITNLSTNLIRILRPGHAIQKLIVRANGIIKNKNSDN